MIDFCEEIWVNKFRENFKLCYKAYRLRSKIFFFSKFKQASCPLVTNTLKLSFQVVHLYSTTFSKARWIVLTLPRKRFCSSTALENDNIWLAVYCDYHSIKIAMKQKRVVQLCTSAQQKLIVGDQDSTTAIFARSSVRFERENKKQVYVLLNDWPNLKNAVASYAHYNAANKRLLAFHWENSFYSLDKVFRLSSKPKTEKLYVFERLLTDLRQREISMKDASTSTLSPEE